MELVFRIAAYFPLLCVCALGKLNIPDSLQSYEMVGLKIFSSAGN